MSEVIASLSVSLDGYFTGPNPGSGQGLGEGGEVLHEWIRGGTRSRAELASNELIREAFERTGAVVCGRDGYDHAEAAWGPEPPFGMPFFVLTHRPRADDVREGTTFHFVDEGFGAALARAREAAGERDVALHGGSPIRQALAAGVLDQLDLQLVPVLLGRGRRLFDEAEPTPAELRLVRVLEAPGVLHLRYEINR